MGIKCPECNFENPDETIYCGKCATSLKPSEEISGIHTETLEAPKNELTRGTTFAERYEIIEELGKGGMGKVYRVEDKKIKEEVALKLIKPEISSDKKTIERFSNELKFARKIAHRNVCKMFDLGEEKGAHYITMEYVPGEDLKSMIRMSKQLSVGTAVSVAKQACEGLTEAHRLGIVHRDLKPSNIMIDKEGNARIMDFGIARSIKGKGITGIGVMIGTPEYMSPEQVEGKEADQRSDIYSLGVILYEMVTGRVPFEGDSTFAIGVKHKGEAPKSPKELNAQIPDDLSRMILRCLEKDKEKRYQSAREMHAELTRIEEGIPTTDREIPRRKPLTSREITVQFSVKKLFIPAFIVIALIIAAVIIWRLLPQKRAVLIPSDKPSLAIVYFENNSGDKSLDNWRSGISELLITDLSQSKFLNVLSGDRIYSILKKLNLLEAQKFSTEDLKKVANQGRVSHILRGSYIKAGENFIITAMLQKPHSGEVIRSIKAECKGEEEIAPKVDELTKEIKVALNLTSKEIAGDIDREVGKITTASSEAYKYYSEGRKSYLKGEYRQSIALLEKALTIDPEFAMAYRSLAWSYDALAYRDRRRSYLQKAFELSDRLSDRERYLIQGDFYQMTERAFDKTLEAYNKLLQLYPDDEIGNINLGDLYLSSELWDKSAERYAINIKNKADSVFSYSGQAAVYMAKGLYEKAKEILEYYIDTFSDNAVIRRDLALAYLCQGKYDLSLVEIDKAIFLDPTYFGNFTIKGLIYKIKGDLIKAEKEYQNILKTEEQPSHQWSRTWLGHLYLSEGKFGKAEDQLKKGLALSKKLGEKGSESGFYSRLAYTYLKSGNLERALEESKNSEKSSVEERGCLYCHQKWALLYKGLAYTGMKSMDEAQRTSDELKELIQKGLNKNYMRLYYHLVGVKELERENFSEAIEYFEKAISLLPFQHSMGNLNDHAFFMEPLALAYYKDGDLEKAREVYEKITSLKLGWVHWGDIYARSFFMLGMIYEEKGWRGKAIEYYEKFLELWKEADSGIAEVEDAKKRLTRLMSQ
ncbi:MAG: protein kinase [Candidatus Aminicenantes bacterium]|nr:protein kinase [Candidatus Aminicenantes bacterium]